MDRFTLSTISAHSAHSAHSSTFFSAPSPAGRRRRLAAAFCGGALLLLLAPMASRAQTGYIGNAYTVKAQANAFLGVNSLLPSVTNVNANAAVFDTGFLDHTNKETLDAFSPSLGASTGVNVDLATSLATATLGAGDILEATARTDETSSQFNPANPTDTAVKSTARITGLNLANTLGGLGGSTLLSALVSADVVESDTSAFFNGTTSGSTLITNLRVNGLTASQLGLQADVNGTISLTQPVQIGVYDSVTVLGNTILHGTQIGTLFLDEQITDPATQALTTNAIHLKLNSNLGLLSTTLGNLAGADVIVSSSTAGFQPAAASVAAPEPGALALFTLGLLPGMGLLGLRARRRRTEGHPERWDAAIL